MSNYTEDKELMLMIDQRVKNAVIKHIGYLLVVGLVIKFALGW